MNYKLPYFFFIFFIFFYLGFAYADTQINVQVEVSDDGEDTCDWKCKDDDLTKALDSQGTLQLLANSTTNLLVVVNQSVEAAALVIDPLANEIALWNGVDGEAIIIDLSKNDVVVLFPEDSPLVWNETSKTVEVWLATVPSLKMCSKVAGKRGHINLHKIPKEIRNDANRIIAKLIPGLEERLKLDPKADGLPLIIKLSQEVIQVLNGPLKGVLHMVHGRVPVTGDIRRLIGVLKMAGDILEKTFSQKSSCSK